MAEAVSTQPPIADTVPTERTHHGDTVIDPYEWLRDKDDPKVVAYLEAENAYTKERTDHLEALRGSIFNEIKARTKETDMTVPSRDGDWWYYTRMVEGSSYGVHCRCPVADPTDWNPPIVEPEVAIPGEQILLDANAEAAGHDFFTIGALSVSDDGNLLAFSTDVLGNERYTMRFVDLRTGERLPDELADIGSGATWASDNEHVFYSTVDDAWRPDSIWRHRLGTPREQDVLVHHEPDESYWTAIGSTRSREYLVIWVGSKITSEMLVLDSANPTGEFRTVLPRRHGVEYSVEHARFGNRSVFLVMHNDGPDAENFTLAQLPVDGSGELTTLIPPSPDVRLEDVDAFAGHAVLSYRREALPRISIAPITADGLGEFVEVASEGLTSTGLGANGEWDAPVLRFGTSGFVTPSRIYNIDMATAERRLLKEAEILGGYDPADYVESRDWATAPDGERIPLSIIARRDTPTDRPAPTFLYGYGSYEASMDPGFSVSRLSLLDRGVVFVIAHVRGGGEMGRRWYEQGKLLHKKNTFTDFVAAARHLVDTGRATPDRLVASGGSAGGLLMGAVANLAPELFSGILADVPFVDPLTSILDPSLPLTVIEWDEWGNPLADPQVYAYMKSYSPYENVEAKRYPAILAITGINDTRVLYVEPAKWVARLRATIPDSSDILLKTEMAAGHGGVSGRYDKWHEVAFEYAWVLDRLGSTERVDGASHAAGQVPNRSADTRG